MSDTVIACGLDGCEYTHTPESAWVEHSWQDSTTAHSISGEPYTVTVYAVVTDTNREREEVCLNFAPDDDPDTAKEVWLSVSEVERLHYLLASAVRRVITFVPNAKAVAR